MNSIMLPEPDQDSIELGRIHLTGKECLPMAVTLGDFLKKLYEEDDDKKQYMFFMPTADGPCRFGQYAPLQKMVFEELGFLNVKMLSPSSIDDYSDLNEDLYGHLFKRYAWRGIVAVDLVQKNLWEIRPYEIEKGETDSIYEWALKELESCVEERCAGLGELMKTIRTKFRKIPIDRSVRKPRIGIVGEIYIRGNRLSNQNIVSTIEQYGGEACVAPMSEWFHYTAFTHNRNAKHNKEYYRYLKGRLEDLYQSFTERRLTKIFKNTLIESQKPSVLELLSLSDKYVESSYEGEAVLSIGKAIDMIRKGKINGIINVLPFSCMPGLIVTALSRKVREDYNNFPWVNIDYDGTEGGNINTKLEAFVYQVREASKGL